MKTGSQLISLVAVVIVLGACASDPSGPGKITGSPATASATPPPNAVIQANSKQKLVLTAPGNLESGADIYDRLTGSSAYKGDGDTAFDASFKKVLVECDANEGAQRTFATSLASLAVTAVFDYLTSWASDAVQNEMKKYTKGYSARANGAFYSISEQDLGQPGKKGGVTKVTNIDPNVKCFRFLRIDPADRHTVMDFIGEVRLSDDRQYFQVRPLSLYYSRPIAAGSPMAVSLELSGESVWYDRDRGHSEKSFDVVVFTEKYSDADLKNPKPRYYFAQAPQAGDDFIPWTDIEKLPLPPLSVDSTGKLMTDNKGRAGPIAMTATVSEVGEMPGMLQALASVLKTEGSNISKGLASAVDTAYNITPSTSSSAKGGGSGN